MVTAKFKTSMNVCPVFLTVEPFVAKFGMVIHHHEPECLAKRLFTTDSTCFWVLSLGMMSLV